MLIEMLNFLEPLDLAALGHSSSAYVHTLAGAMKRAFADRAEFLGDPDFVAVPVSGMTSKIYAKRRWKDFDPDRTRPAREPRFAVMSGTGLGSVVGSLASSPAIACNTIPASAAERVIGPM